MDADGCMPVLGACAACFLLGFWAGGYVFESSADTRWQNEIESRGYAEYYIDENHDVQWRWTVDEKVGER